jgi:SET domain-containing protein
MFTLNDEYILDAARFGGIIRFANHSSKPNCQVKILLVNGDHRQDNRTIFISKVKFELNGFIIWILIEV